MVVVKALFQGIIISVISAYAPHCGLDNSQKDAFYDGSIVFMIALSLLLENQGRQKLQLQQETLMVTLEVAQKTKMTSMEVMVME